MNNKSTSMKKTGFQHNVPKVEQLKDTKGF